MRFYKRLATSAFNSALSPVPVGESTMDLFDFMKSHLNQPIDIFETIQRPTIDVLGKLVFGHKFGVRYFLYRCIVSFIFIIIIDP